MYVLFVGASINKKIHKVSVSYAPEVLQLSVLFQDCKKVGNSGIPPPFKQDMGKSTRRIYSVRLL